MKEIGHKNKPVLLNSQADGRAKLFGRISVCINNQETAREITSLIGEKYHVILVDNGKINGEQVDAYVLDFEMFLQNKEHLLELKKIHSPEIVPILVLTDNKEKLLTNQDVWEIADDIYELTSGNKFLLSRVQLLMKYRKMSTSLTKSQTKLRSLNKDLKEESDFLHYTANNLPGIFYVFDEDMNYVYWNQKFEDDLGYSNTDIQKLTPHDIVCKEDTSLLNEKLQEVFSNGSAVMNTELITKDGRRRNYMVTGAKITKGGKTLITGSGVDITEKVKAEYESNQQKRLMEAIINQTKSVIYVKDIEGVMKLVNQAYLDLFGLTNEEVIGRKEEDILGKKLRNLIYLNDLAVHNSNEVKEFEESIVIDGELRHFNSTKYKLFDVPGFEGCLCGISTEITSKITLMSELKERVKEKNCLHEVARKSEKANDICKVLTESVEIIPEGFLHPDSTYVQVSFGEVKSTTPGFSEKDVLLESTIYFVDSTPLQLRIALSPSNRTDNNLEFLDEKLKLINGICEVLTSRIGRIINFDKLLESEQKWINLAQNDPDLLMIIQDGKIEFLNNAGSRMYGKTPDEIIGKNLFELVSVEEQELASERLKKVLKGETVEPYLHKITNPIDQTVRYIQVQSIYIQKNGKGAIQIVGTDLTERIHFEEELKAALSEKQVLLQEIHHRVKNNLAVVSGLLQLQLMDSDCEVFRKTLTKSVTRISSMALIHEQLYKSESLTHLDFKDYASELIHHLQKTINRDNSINIQMDIDPPVILNVNQAVPCALILNELITNSIKHAFSEKRSGRTIDIKMTEKQGSVYLEVRDNGKGFSNDLLNDNSSMGITILKALVTQLKGDFISTNKNGAFVSLTFDKRETKGSSSTFI